MMPKWVAFGQESGSKLKHNTGTGNRVVLCVFKKPRNAPSFYNFHTPHSHAHHQKALPYPSLVLLHLILPSQIVLICNIGIYLRQPGGLK